tara:strand:- start:553 stop:1287 length:735 start_codon:yes stop_codon:yes gene_type:complete
MFVIPCRYTGGSTPEEIKKSYVLKSVASMRRLHPDEKILVVDSNSEDTSYLESLNKINNVIGADAKNVNYLDGALWYALENYPDEEWFCLLQDTITLKKDLYEFINGEEEFYSLMWWDEVIYEKDRNEMDWLDEMFDNYLPAYASRRPEIGYPETIKLAGCWGPCFVAKRSILERLKKNNLNLCLPVDKFGAQMAERLWSICLGFEGVDVKANTIDGDFLKIALPRDHFNSKTIYHEKIYGGRP